MTQELLTINNKLTGQIISRENINIKSLGPEKIIVQGLFLPKDQISRNGVLYDWGSIEEHYHELVGRSFLYNHLNESDKKPIGRFTDSALLVKRPSEGSKWRATWDKTTEINGKDTPGWYYEADVNPKSEYADSILRGDLNKVSIQTMAAQSRQERDETDGTVYTRAFISDILEGSVVPTPGFVGTSMEVVLAEAFRVKESQTTTNNPIQTKTPEETKEELDKAIEELTDEEANYINSFLEEGLLLDVTKLTDTEAKELLQIIKL